MSYINRDAAAVRQTIEEAERLLGYWDAHGDNPDVVSKWAVSDLRGFLGQVLELLEGGQR